MNVLLNWIQEVFVECLTCVFFCLSEGVQLLCLIDKAADACRYLQTYGEWNRAAWLAKVTRHDAVHQQETSRSFVIVGNESIRLP